jgi:hypothetical protein
MTQTTNMVSAKIMWNSVISMPNAKFGNANMKNMHLETPLDQYECIKMLLRLMPKDIKEHYAWLGISIFGSDFWDPHRNWNSDSIFESGYSGRNSFFEFRC